MLDTETQTVLDHVRLTAADLGNLLDAYRSLMSAQVAAIVDQRDGGGVVIPVVSFGDVASGTVDDDLRATIRQRGCVIVRGAFDRALAEDWDRQLGEYLDTNQFWNRYAERDPVGASTGSRIAGVYWSRPQIEARQHDNMATVREFLNGFWKHESEGRTWFDPTHDIGYPDRIRRREPGVSSKGLNPHTDSASAAGWRLPENLLVNRHVLAGNVVGYDPYDAAYRTDPLGPIRLPSDVFRTFQGWTALSEMWPTDGVLHAIPIPAAASYLVLKGLAADCGLLPDEPESPRRIKADDLLMPALSPISTVHPGDTVWWHGDLIHSVGAASNEIRSGNVMYIAATPTCPRNDKYANGMVELFNSGESPRDFPNEGFEMQFTNRASTADLNPRGRQMFALP
jgi:hypothetical protein